MLYGYNPLFHSSNLCYIPAASVSAHVGRKTPVQLKQNIRRVTVDLTAIVLIALPLFAGLVVVLEDARVNSAQ
jgi:hypothetical protein